MKEYSKIVQTEIKKAGSLEAYKAEMAKRGSEGGKAPHPKGRGFQLMDKKKLSEVSKKAGKMGKRVYG